MSMLSPLSRGHGTWDGGLLGRGKEKKMKETLASLDPLDDGTHRHGITISPRMPSMRLATATYRTGEKPDGELLLPKTFTTRKGALVLFTPSGQELSLSPSQQSQLRHNFGLKTDQVDVSAKFGSLTRFAHSVLTFGDQQEYPHDSASISDSDNKVFLKFLRRINDADQQTTPTPRPGSDVTSCVRQLRVASAKLSSNRARSAQSGGRHGAPDPGGEGMRAYPDLSRWLDTDKITADSAALVEQATRPPTARYGDDRSPTPRSYPVLSSEKLTASLRSVHSYLGRYTTPEQGTLPGTLPGALNYDFDRSQTLPVNLKLNKSSRQQPSRLSSATSRPLSTRSRGSARSVRTNAETEEHERLGAPPRGWSASPGDGASVYSVDIQRSDSQLLEEDETSSGRHTFPLIRHDDVTPGEDLERSDTVLSGPEEYEQLSEEASNYKPPPEHQYTTKPYSAKVLEPEPQPEKEQLQSDDEPITQYCSEEEFVAEPELVSDPTSESVVAEGTTGAATCDSEDAVSSVITVEIVGGRHSASATPGGSRLSLLGSNLSLHSSPSGGLTQDYQGPTSITDLPPAASRSVEQLGEEPTHSTELLSPSGGTPPPDTDSVAVQTTPTPTQGARSVKPPVPHLVKHVRSSRTPSPPKRSAPIPAPRMRIKSIKSTPNSASEAAPRARPPRPSPSSRPSLSSARRPSAAARPLTSVSGISAPSGPTRSIQLTPVTSGEQKAPPKEPQSTEELMATLLQQAASQPKGSKSTTKTKKPSKGKSKGGKKAEALASESVADIDTGEVVEDTAKQAALLEEGADSSQQPSAEPPATADPDQLPQPSSSNLKDKKKKDKKGTKAPSGDKDTESKDKPPADETDKKRRPLNVLISTTKMTVPQKKPKPKLLRDIQEDAETGKTPRKEKKEKKKKLPLEPEPTEEEIREKAKENLKEKEEKEEEGKQEKKRRLEEAFRLQSLIKQKDEERQVTLLQIAERREALEADLQQVSREAQEARVAEQQEAAKEKASTKEDAKRGKGDPSKKKEKKPADIGRRKTDAARGKAAVGKSKGPPGDAKGQGNKGKADGGPAQTAIEKVEEAKEPLVVVKAEAAKKKNDEKKDDDKKTDEKKADDAEKKAPADGEKTEGEKPAVPTTGTKDLEEHMQPDLEAENTQLRRLEQQQKRLLEHRLFQQPKKKEPEPYWNSHNTERQQRLEEEHRKREEEKRLQEEEERRKAAERQAEEEARAEQARIEGEARRKLLLERREVNLERRSNLHGMRQSQNVNHSWAFSYYVMWPRESFQNIVTDEPKRKKQNVKFNKKAKT